MYSLDRWQQGDDDHRASALAQDPSAAHPARLRVARDQQQPASPLSTAVPSHYGPITPRGQIVFTNQAYEGTGRPPQQQRPHSSPAAAPQAGPQGLFGLHTHLRSNSLGAEQHGRATTAADAERQYSTAIPTAAEQEYSPAPWQQEDDGHGVDSPVPSATSRQSPAAATTTEILLTRLLKAKKRGDQYKDLYQQQQRQCLALEQQLQATDADMRALTQTVSSLQGQVAALSAENALQKQQLQDLSQFLATQVQLGTQHMSTQLQQPLGPLAPAVASAPDSSSMGSFGALQPPMQAHGGFQTPPAAADMLPPGLASSTQPPAGAPGELLAQRQYGSTPQQPAASNNSKAANLDLSKALRTAEQLAAYALSPRFDGSTAVSLFVDRIRSFQAQLQEQDIDLSQATLAAIIKAKGITDRYLSSRGSADPRLLNPTSVQDLVAALQAMHPCNKGALQQALTQLRSQPNLPVQQVYAQMEAAYSKFGVDPPSGKAVRDLLYYFPAQRRMRMETVIMQLQQRFSAGQQLSMATLRQCVEVLSMDEEDVYRDHSAANSEQQGVRAAAAYPPATAQQPPPPQRQQLYQHLERGQGYQRGQGGGQRPYPQQQQQHNRQPAPALGNPDLGPPAPGGPGPIQAGAMRYVAGGLSKQLLYLNSRVGSTLGGVSISSSSGSSSCRGRPQLAPATVKSGLPVGHSAATTQADSAELNAQVQAAAMAWAQFQGSDSSNNSSGYTGAASSLSHATDTGSLNSPGQGADCSNNSYSTAPGSAAATPGSPVAPSSTTGERTTVHQTVSTDADQCFDATRCNSSSSSSSSATQHPAGMEDCAPAVLDFIASASHHLQQLRAGAVAMHLCRQAEPL